jgi:hypothetical protein
MTIWKFPIEITDEQVIEVPKVNRPLDVQIQSGTPCIWMAVDPDSPRIQVKARVFGTGHPGVTPDMDYIGTFQFGPLVFHVFFVGWTELNPV